MTTQSAKALLLSRMEGLRQMPTIPAVLQPLLSYLELPTEQVDVHRVTEMIAQDKALAAQCLQMANSPLFGRWQKIESLKSAVVALGVQRVSHIAMSCSVLNLLPTELGGINPVVFWEHSLGCALACRHLARQISAPDPGKVYLAGLLHDIGIVLNLWVLPEEFQNAYDLARAEGLPLHEAEDRVLGFTHAESGALLAERWELPADLQETILLHHGNGGSAQHSELIAMVEICDLLCRMSGLNYGFIEKREVNLLKQSAVAVLSRRYPDLEKLDWARLTFELEAYMDEVHSLVHAVYRKGS
ncbi:MAG TPA: HDOD domain-containing protein [Dongiaceae bacterium]|nr:HDOD domain-containing protein [Dongiaceae bacterium]